MPLEPVCVRFARRETGWALPEGRSGLYRVANIPLTDRYNIDDLVELAPPTGGRPRRIRRLLETPFPGKAVLYYPDMRAFHRLTAVLTEFGCRCEGWCAPGDRGPGLLAVAYLDDYDPVETARRMGYPQPED